VAIKLVFCGTPQFAVPTLERLSAAGFDLQLVVTQPDKPRGRGMEVSRSPVKQTAIALGLPIAQPEKVRNNEEFQKQLRELSPDAIVVVGYGKLIPKWMLEVPPLGNINLHASLLPKYRGAAPIQWAIANGEGVTGNTTMLLNEGLDTGDILLQQEELIAEFDTSLTLGPRLAFAGAELMVETLRGLESNKIKPRKQDDSRATLAPILNKEDGKIDFSRTAREIYNRMRGFQPWPGAFTTFRGKKLSLLEARLSVSESAPSPGEIAAQGDSLLVGCGQNSAMVISELQLEGKRRMSAREFINGYRPQPGERLGG
jgi:methionyl-tRNA formyltransferase